MANQIRNTMGDDARLTGSGAREHQEGPAQCFDRGLLCRIQTVSHDAKQSRKVVPLAAA
jgi:hypothetical protein